MEKPQAWIVFRMSFWWFAYHITRVFAIPIFTVKCVKCVIPLLCMWYFSQSPGEMRLKLLGHTFRHLWNGCRGHLPCSREAVSCSCEIIIICLCHMRRTWNGVELEAILAVVALSIIYTIRQPCTYVCSDHHSPVWQNGDPGIVPGSTPSYAESEYLQMPE